MNKLKLAVFGVLGTLILMTSFSCFAQEKVDSDVFSSDKYKALKDHYIELTEIVKKQQEQPAAKDFLKKIGQDNFINATQNGNNLTEWLEDNWQSTSFISFEEAKEYLDRIYVQDAEVKEAAKKMMPMFSEVKEEVGYKTMFDRLEQDYQNSRTN